MSPALVILARKDMSPALVILGILLLQTGAQGFGILPGNSQSHLEITEEAILNVTVQVCRALAESQGNDFTFPSQPFTITGVAVACRAENSIKRFQLAITSIIFRNVRVDLLQALNASFHFDDESFISGRNIITAGLQTVKANNRQQNFEAAQENLGKILHPLQDFYSHSNWVENGNEFPNSNLIRSDTSIGNIADESRATCRSCDGDDCSNNILEDIIQEQILTSGYFGIIPVVSTKPSGKCSHGGALDLTSRIEPTGGINKDMFDSEHGFLHTVAANLAVSATSEILENIRQAAGDAPFLQMLGISRGSGKALCFAIDTTQSMSDDIAAVQSATSSFINSQVGTINEPSSYILVQFNDPEFGPLIRTSDPEVFKNNIDDLSASGGGDEGELSLSGLQLVLSNAPQSSDIFLFTDAPAKDQQLKSTVIVLIERTQSVVYFLITGTGDNRRRRRSNSDLQQHKRISSSDVQLYRDLAQAAGGLVIEVENDELLEATSIIGQMSSSSVVTLVQASVTPTQETETFIFIVDRPTNIVRLLITGNPSRIVLGNPEGIMVTVGGMGADRLISSSQSVGNFQTLELRTEEVGTWKVQIAATNPYTLKATSQNPLDFLFDFVEYVPSKNTFDVLDTRPTASTNGSLVVTLTGSDTATVTEVTLVESASLVEVQGVVEPQGRRNFLVRVDTIPSVPFVVRVKGIVNTTSGESISFQRQSSTSFQASNLTIRAEADRNLMPGMVLSVPFSVNTEGTGGNVSIRVTTNNPLYTVSAPSTLPVEPGVTANSTVALSVPLDTPSGTTVTLVIEAEGTGDLDINYIVLRISVLNPVTDFTAPVCEVLCIVNCVHDCNTTSWELSLRVSDGTEGTGVERVSLTQGNGTLNIRPAPDDRNVILATYNASCDSPDVELLVVDGVGNVGTCAFNAFNTTSGGVASSLTQTPLSCAVLTLALGVMLSLNVW
ncbi:von Willebrand factor A domain-containing protein 7-like [Phyllopteryx taeniolatus]|uniref:von Willebrand factor A domain-containing protein 7-like n=1 Tax=Phyllopteryx taeniolatus TaxID=161469 RepID=UPI002AD215BF|nr:von Willebrand factor A domain-containing protein 7-like [Phyllopteryx taeniolatus]